jgi:site-specific recombinase XerD
VASLKKRNGTYYIRFFKSVDGKPSQKALSLGTSQKREAEKLLIEYEERFERGEIDPFNGWSPKIEAERKRKKLSGKYISLEKATDLFINARSQANQRTKDNYRKHLKMLMEVLGRTMPVTQIVESDIRNLCFRSDLAAATQASYLRHFKVFFKWLFENDILKVELTKNIKAPRIPQKITQKTVSKEELELIFEAFDKYYKMVIEKGHVTKPEQQRLWFKPMIYTIYYCGLRAKEAVNLTWKDVSIKEKSTDGGFGIVRISNTGKNTSKSGKERIIPIRKPMYPWILQWYKVKVGLKTDMYSQAQQGLINGIKWILLHYLSHLRNS